MSRVASKDVHQQEAEWEAGQPELEVVILIFYSAISSGNILLNQTQTLQIFVKKIYVYKQVRI